MIELESKVKKWGNSLGIVIPKEIANKISLKSEEKVRIFIEKPEGIKVEGIFGIAQFKKPTSKIMKEIDRELDISL